MAPTTPANVDSSIPELWSKRVLREHLRAGFWGRFVGDPGSGAPIIQQSELLNNPGDKIHIQVTDPLTGTGVRGDTTQLEGSEENLTSSEITCIPDVVRHGVRTYRRADKKSILDLRSEARMRLSEWGAEYMDDARFQNFLLTGVDLDGVASFGGDHGSEAYDANLYIVGGGTDADDVAASDTLTVEALQEISLKLYEQKAKPLSVDGDEMFVIVTSARSLHALKREAEYRDWVREAHLRGPSNPFFRGAVAVIDGMIIHRHTNVPVTANATSVPVAQGIAFGREAFVEALDENTSWAEDTFDYGNELGVAYGFAFEPRRALELSSVQVLSASPDPF
jgi:N4-gp56 family major capsid protein